MCETNVDSSWQENKLNELYYAFATSEEDGLRLFLNLVFENYYAQPSFLEKIYNRIYEIKDEDIYDVSARTLEWVEFWRSFDNTDNQKNPKQKEMLYSLIGNSYLSPNTPIRKPSISIRKVLTPTMAWAMFIVL
jgi:hypothetical protein